MTAVLRLLVAFVALALPATALAQSLGSPYTSAVRYDDLNRVTGTIAPDADGASPYSYPATRTTYDDVNRKVTVETGALSSWQPESVAPSAWTGFTLFTKAETQNDVLDRKSVVTLWGWDASLSTPAWVEKSVTQYSYDPVGRAECSTVRMDSSTWSALPASACTLATSGTAPDPDRVTKNVYDDAGQVLKVVKALGTPLQQDYVTYTYSDNGKPLTVKDADGNVAGYTYDGFDRMVAWAFASKTTTGAIAPCTLGSITETTDAFGVLVTGPSGAPVAGDDCERYSYDRDGNRTKLVKRDARVFTYNYDALNRPIVKTVPGACVTGFACTTPPTSAVRDVYYSYDVRGEQLYARFGSASGTDTVDTVYDGFGRASSQTVAMGGVSRSVSYAYTSESLRRKITWPDAVGATYMFDQLDRMTTANVGGAAVASMTYDAQSRPWTETRGSVVTTFGYDLVSRLASLDDNLSGAAGDQTSTYSYNLASQLVSRTRTNTAYAWTGYTNVSRSYAVNGLNQYTTAGPATFGYDANGNLASDGTSSFTYDAENRLVADGAGNTLVYDPQGRLYSVANTSGTETYLYAGDQRIAEYDGTGTMTARYVPGSGKDNPLLWYVGAPTTAPRALQGDERGSIVSVADSGGALIAINSYDEYGIPASGNIGRYQYTGQLWVPQLGLYYYKARFYSPTLGRFLQTDPIGYADQNNLYAYANNDSMDGSDPTGLASTIGGCTGSISCTGSYSLGSIGIGTTGAQGAAANQSKAPSGGTARGAAAAYGESGSLYPQLKDPKKGLYNIDNWQDESLVQLENARSTLVIVAARNPGHREDDQSSTNDPLLRHMYAFSVVAAQYAQNMTVPKNVQFFVLRDAKINLSPSPSFPGKLYVNTSLYRSFGPFVNNGSGRFGTSNQIYIDFYQNDGPKKP